MKNAIFYLYQNKCLYNAKGVIVYEITIIYFQRSSEIKSVVISELYHTRLKEIASLEDKSV